MDKEQFRLYRQNKLKTGGLFQDFVVDVCSELLGLHIQQYTSREYQIAVGESRTGVEIKHDELYKKYGNLYIETGEKAQPRSGDYWPSGIYRNDNAWLYVTGDYDRIWGFPKRYLVALDQATDPRTGQHRYTHVEHNSTGTSKGFKLPLSDADRYSAFILEPKASVKVAKYVHDLEGLGRELHIAAKAEAAGQFSLFAKVGERAGIEHIGSIASRVAGKFQR